MNPIDEASEALTAAIEIERRAVFARAEAERRVVALMPPRDAGAVILRGERYRASISYSITHSIDPSAIPGLEKAVPAALLNQAITRQPVVLPAGLLYLRHNEPATYQVVARAITTRRTPSVQVELLNPPMAASA